MTPAGPKRVLAVRVGRGGDLVMITPALRMLLDGLPDAELDLLTSTDGPRILRGFDPRLARFHVYHRRFPAALLLRPRLRAALRREGYERIYLFESHPHYRALVEGAASEVHTLGDATQERHYCDRCMDVVEPTLARPQPRGWISLPVTEAARAAASGYLAAHGIADGDRLVGLHLTFSESARGLFAGRRGLKNRVWPDAAGAELARRLVEHGRSQGRPIRPVVDILPHERGLLAGFLERAGDAVTVLSGPPDFERYKAVLARLALLVTPNTGPMHVAAAAGTPVVALFSGWSPAECGPFVPPGRARILRAEDTAEPARGLAALSADAVFEACRVFLP
jgi:ADP-heptose:LPS heptosyltransferase